MIAFKDKSNFEIEKILINCYRHFGMVFIDFFTQQSLNKKNILNYVVFHKKNQRLLQNSSGGVIMSAHFGNWESVLPALGLNNIKMETVLRKQRNDSANNLYIKRLVEIENENGATRNGAINIGLGQEDFFVYIRERMYGK